MKNALLCILVFSVSLFSFMGHADEGPFYVVASAGYAMNKIDSDTHDELSYKLNFGYTLSEEWAVEVGYQGLGDAGLSNEDLLTSSDGLQEADYNVSAIQLSVLGRASNQHGELFYRIGVMQVNTESTFVLDASECLADNALVATQSDSVICSSDENEMAGIIGIGFDFYITRSLLLRAEIEHIQGREDYSAQALLLGLRYSF
jgi:opacity protein-like surface antigen